MSRSTTQSRPSRTYPRAARSASCATPPRPKSPARLAERRLQNQAQRSASTLAARLAAAADPSPSGCPAASCLRSASVSLPAVRDSASSLPPRASPGFSHRDVESGIRVDPWSCRRCPPRRGCVLPPPARAASSLRRPLVPSDRRASLSVESFASLGLVTAGRGSPRLHRFCLGLLPCLVTPAGEGPPAWDCGSLVGSARVAPLACISHRVARRSA